jgi:molybdopterin converting factor small subunit
LMLHFDRLSKTDAGQGYREGILEVEAGINLRQLRRKLKPDRLALRLLPVFVNGERVKGSYKLRPGDLIVFLMPISGGCV